MSGFLITVTITVIVLCKYLVIGFLEIPEKYEKEEIFKGGNVTLECGMQDDKPITISSLQVVWEKINDFGQSQEIYVNTTRDNTGLKAGWKGKAYVSNTLELGQQLRGTTTLTLFNVINVNEGNYWCTVIHENSTDYGMREILVYPKLDKGILVAHQKGSRRKREDQVPWTQVVQIPHRQPAENLLVGLIKDFAIMKGTDRITACMPIPKAAGDPLEWGIITSPLPQVEGNKTIQCKEVKIIEKINVTGYYRKKLSFPV